MQDGRVQERYKTHLFPRVTKEIGIESRELLPEYWSSFQLTFAEDLM